MGLKETFALLQHIEKTGGTTLLHDVLIPFLGAEHIYTYKPSLNAFRRVAKPSSNQETMLSWIKTIVRKTPLAPFAAQLKKKLTLSSKPAELSLIELSKLRSPVYIRGHYDAALISYLSHRKTMSSIVLRHPLNRMESQFKHHLRAKGNTDWRVRMPSEYNDIKQFEQFALDSRWANYQSQAVGDVPLSDYEVVGVTEELCVFSIALLRALDKNPGIFQLRQHNASTASDPELSLTPEIIAQFETMHAKDYELYEEALGRSRQLSESIARAFV